MEEEKETLIWTLHSMVAPQQAQLWWKIVIGCERGVNLLRTWNIPGYNCNCALGCPITEDPEHLFVRCPFLEPLRNVASKYIASTLKTKETLLDLFSAFTIFWNKTDPKSCKKCARAGIAYLKFTWDIRNKSSLIDRPYLNTNPEISSLTWEQH